MHLKEYITPPPINRFKQIYFALLFTFIFIESAFGSFNNQFVTNYCAPGSSIYNCTLIRNPNGTITNLQNNNNTTLNVSTDITINSNNNLIENSINSVGIFYVNISSNVTLNNSGSGNSIFNRANSKIFITNNGTIMGNGREAVILIYGSLNGRSAVINNGTIMSGSNGISIRFVGNMAQNNNFNGGIAVDNRTQGRINGWIRIENSSLQTIRNVGYIDGINLNGQNGANYTLQSLNNSGTIIQIENNGTLTTFNNIGNTGTITNNGTITNLNNSGYINTLHHNNTNTITLTTSNNGTISHLTNAGTINTNTSLVIAGVNNTNGSLTNNGTINATNAQVSVYGNFNNTGTINTQTLTLGSSNPTPSATTTAHIDGTINNGAGGGTHLVLNDFAVELTQMANDYNALADLRNNTIGHIIIGNNANINAISAGNGANNRGIMIIADTDKWYQPYDYDALFVKNNNLASANNINIDTISAANLYTAQSTIQIYDVINPTNNKKAFQLNIQAKDSPA